MLRIQTVYSSSVSYQPPYNDLYSSATYRLPRQGDCCILLCCWLPLVLFVSYFVVTLVVIIIASAVITGEQLLCLVPRCCQRYLQ